MSSRNNHPALATEFVRDEARTKWHDEALWFVRSKRDLAAATVPEWETLRSVAEQIKAHVIANLAELLEQFERNATARGIQVHWARDGDEHNRIILDILKRHNATKVVKSKSMLTEECHLNPCLEANKISVVDTDLGERIVQLRGESPSHIVLPAIHIKKEEVAETFHEHLGTDAGVTDAQYLTEAARQHLRDHFMNADVGITGVNFAIADTGGFVVCTNEGNADLGVSLPRVHIACMGLEKIIPRYEDLAVFTRLLARSATGQPITAYTSHFHGPRENGELHVVIVDNGRTSLRSDENFRRSLSCIRCGACMNTCPVYRRSGGHSYQSTVPGPIGSILAPAQDAHKYHTLPFACSLCGSCTDVCPVKIDLHHELLTWRREIARRNVLPRTKKWSMQLTSAVLRRPWLYRLAGATARIVLRWTPRWILYSRLNTWGRQREMPNPPAKSFRQLYRERRKRS